MNTQKITHDPFQSTFADRIKLLIQRVGSATEIARMCGFSEGVVRSWRDGHTDPSRARCVTLARTLGISLIWLVAGEGALQIDPSATNTDDSQYSSETVSPHRARGRIGHAHRLAAVADTSVDPRRLNTAMQILQSELELANSPLTLAENTDMLTNLYEILGTDGSSVDATAMLRFNRQLAERIRQSKSSREIA
ncbi:multiprotein-bridging factor 1 family protein [Rhodanobacter sp. Si-c]|uniref:Multiprotein-bridging factor 1 family protein n=1 Tax=Rhodanobacter lycopersici TaxID=3162487 RepID=A0ABV3QHZ4_9GAMM